MKLVHKYTKDGLNLLGGHWEPSSKETCIVLIHGMYDNIIENCFAQQVGRDLAAAGYGFIFCHTRGYGVINSIIVKNPATGKRENKIIGSTYEKFAESIYDVEAWIEKAKELGYKKVILASHSMGGCKNLHYISTKGDAGIEKFLFISIPDAVGYFNNYEVNRLKEAKDLVEKGRGKELLSEKIVGGIFPISARTMCGFRRGSSIDRFPIMDNPDDFGILSKIEKPVCMILAEHDSVIVKSAKEDLALVKSKMKNCSNFYTDIVEGATHRFINKEKQLSVKILAWLKSFEG